MLSIKELYVKSIPGLISDLKLNNKMEVPKIVKVSINMGLGKLSCLLYTSDAADE